MYRVNSKDFEPNTDISRPNNKSIIRNNYDFPLTVFLLSLARVLLCAIYFAHGVIQSEIDSDEITCYEELIEARQHHKGGLLSAVVRMALMASFQERLFIFLNGLSALGLIVLIVQDSTTERNASRDSIRDEGGKYEARAQQLTSMFNAFTYLGLFSTAIDIYSNLPKAMDHTKMLFDSMGQAAAVSYALCFTTRHALQLCSLYGGLDIHRSLATGTIVQTGEKNILKGAI